MDKETEKTAGRKSVSKKTIGITAVVVVVLAVCIGIGFSHSDANRLRRHLDLGQKYLDEMNYEQALAEFDKALEIDPRCADAYIGMALTYESMGNDPAALMTLEEGYANSLEMYDRLLELDGGDERVLDLLSSTLTRYMDVLMADQKYDEIGILAEKYGPYAVKVDFDVIPAEIEENVLDTTLASADAAPAEPESAETGESASDVNTAPEESADDRAGGPAFDTDATPVEPENSEPVPVETSGTPASDTDVTPVEPENSEPVPVETSGTPASDTAVPVEPENSELVPVETSGIQVQIRETGIVADSVSNMDGYGSLVINGSGYEVDEVDDFVLPQTALVDRNGSLLFPYQSDFGQYRISDGIISLTKSNPYSTSSSAKYYRLDGSSVGDLQSGSSEGSFEGYSETEYTYWHGGPMQDGYALVIKVMITDGGGAWEYHSYIMDRNGVITCTLPEEFNEEIFWEGDDFSIYYMTSCSLGWCGEGLFAVFENNTIEDEDQYEWYTSGVKGYMDAAGNMVLDLTGRGFMNAGPFHEGLAAVEDGGGRIGFIDETGAQVIPCIYERAFSSFSEDGICPVQKDGKWGYIDRNNSVVIPFEYDYAYGAGAGMASVMKGGKCGLVDYSNRIVVPLEYDDISSCDKGAAYAVKNRAVYIITKSGS